MKRTFGLILLLMLTACQAATPVRMAVLALTGTPLINIPLTDADTAGSLLSRAGLTLAQGDSLLFNGQPIHTDFVIPEAGEATLQVLPAHMVKISTPEKTSTLQTSAGTVAGALNELGLPLYQADWIAPPADTPITDDLTIHYIPSKEFTFTDDGQVVRLRTTQAEFGKALAAAGYAPGGLDLLDADAGLPSDGGSGSLSLQRVSETLSVQETLLPFNNQVEYTDALPVGERKVVTLGSPGVKIRLVRSKSGSQGELSSNTEAELPVKDPVQGLVQVSSKVASSTIKLPGGELKYWRALQMYTTAYSPCRTGTGTCSYKTANGSPVQRGVVAVTLSLYQYLAGSQVYIPGYGQAVIADAGGGFPDGRPWIDLAFSDEDFVSWSGYHLVYFLDPPPAMIPPELLP